MFNLHFRIFAGKLFYADHFVINMKNKQKKGSQHLQNIKGIPWFE